MAISNRDRVGRALELLRSGLLPFVERELRAKYGEDWLAKARESMGDTPTARNATSPDKLDVPALINMIIGLWQYVFRYKLSKTDRSLLGELQEVRNRWAHQEPFGLDDTNRALDSTKRLLTSVAAPEADEVDKQLQDVLRQKFEDLQKRETKKAAAVSVEGKFTTGLPPWRDVITPHDDVAKGNYLLAEFAADLWQVYQDQFDTQHRAPAEYTDPAEFFRRTYLTEGLADLLTLGINRICGKPADPVVKLQTNFGGGKTHSMLALYHLFGGVAPANLTGVEPLLRKLGITTLPKVSRAVLVGNKLSLTGFRKPDGIRINTLWGELAWQLGHSRSGAAGAKEAYEMVRADDEKGVCPAAIVDLLRKHSPCIVLIDEWVAYVRQLYNLKDLLPAGGFDANITFAQSLTEAFKAAPGAFLVASLPASDIEIGGEGGREALKRLENTFDRVQTTWRPATTDECFEIVRRRLFKPIEADRYAARDAVARAFAEMYRQNGAEFPPECREGDYERRITNSYPIHPELFDRLFQDWSQLERFQKTRGVLRLMAAVIHSLWESQDANLLILPSMVPLHDRHVFDESKKVLDDPWVSVVEKDVDGPQSLPLRLDRDNPNLGRLSACRRVARTLFMGTAPGSGSQNRGVDDRRVKLGCTQPGESAAAFGDALRRLSDQATHVYVDQSRYWLGTQANVTRLAMDRAAQLEGRSDEVHAEIARRLKEETNSKGEFAKVHVYQNHSDIPDELETRLVILPPEHPHIARAADSPALRSAKETLEFRGTSPRQNRNTLVFLAADKTRLGELEQAVRQHLAWKSIVEESTPVGDGVPRLNLDGFQRSQAVTKAREANDTVKQRVPETYHWLLAPHQPSLQGPIEWPEVRLQGAEGLAPRASKKLIGEQGLATKLAGTVLRMELDKIPLWRGDQVSVKTLVDDFAKYLYLQRIKNPQVLLDAIRDGVGLLTWASDTFAYADAWDEKNARYLGLRVTIGPAVVADGRSLVVKADAAQRQLAAEEAARAASTPAPTNGHGAGNGSVTVTPPPAGATATTAGPTGVVSPPQPKNPTRFYATAELEPLRLATQAGQIAKEVLAQLSALRGAEVRVRLEIEAELPSGADPGVVRAVTENCRTLKFKAHEFEA